MAYNNLPYTITAYDFTAYKNTAYDFMTFVLQPVENVSVSPIFFLNSIKRWTLIHLGLLGFTTNPKEKCIDLDFVNE